MRSPALLFTFLITATLPFRPAFAQQTRPNPSEGDEDLRVGLISYDDPSNKVKEYQALFSELRNDPTVSIRYKPRFAVGTYADVLDWISRGLVDVAVLSPNAFAETTAWKKKDPNAAAPFNKDFIDCIYIATEGKIPAAADSSVNEKLKQPSEPGKGRFEYNSLCIVSAEKSQIKNLNDLKAQADRGNVQFIFGDPMSASSTIFPMHFLIAHNIDFRKHMEYSFGHSDSVDRILEPPSLAGNGQNEPERVAFVQDLAVLDTQQKTPDDKRQRVRIIEGASGHAMRDMLLPMEVWVARKDFDKENVQVAGEMAPRKKSETLRAALLNHLARYKWPKEETVTADGNQKKEERDKVPGENKDFTYHDERKLESRIAPLYAWARQIKGLLAQPDDSPLNKDYSGDSAANIPGTKFPIRFEDIVSLVRHYNTQIYKKAANRKPPRLALVLSGGGAKCAYEAGAVQAIEATLSRLQSARPKDPIDIDLVVGTSGGALNAIPIAAGITSQNTPGTPPLEQTWQTLNALDIIKPPLQVEVLLGICFAFVCLFLVRAAVFVSSKEVWHGFALWMLPIIFLLSLKSVLALMTHVNRLGELPAIGAKSWLIGSSLYAAFYFLIARPIVRLIKKWTKDKEPNETDAIYPRTLGVLLAAVPGLICLLFVFRQIAIAYLLRSPRHLLFYPVLLGSWLRFAVLLSVFFGSLVLWFNWQTASSRPQGVLGNGVNRLIKMPLARILLIAGVWFLVALLFAAATRGGVFRGGPLEDVVIACYAKIFPKDNDDTTGTLREQISCRIYNARGRRRDLVITGSSLTEDSRGARYFYLRGKSQPTDKPPSYGSRGVEIGEEASCRPDRLLDVALGSGTIFPVFPSHKVESVGSSKEMQLVDGGFAHNSPVEAAVLWGATHIVLIGASPETENQGDVNDPVISNLLKAFGFLFDQAQMADVNAQEEAAVFTLRPTQGGPRIGIVDFGSGFARVALNKGANEGSGRAFIRQPAKPLFWDTK